MKFRTTTKPTELERVFAKELLKRLKHNADWCFTPRPESNSAKPCVIINKEGKRLEFHSHCAAEMWIGLKSGSLTKHGGGKGWKLEKYHTT